MSTSLFATAIKSKCFIRKYEQGSSQTMLASDMRGLQAKLKEKSWEHLSCNLHG
jgi:hypothetical protein